VSQTLTEPNTKSPDMFFVILNVCMQMIGVVHLLQTNICW